MTNPNGNPPTVSVPVSMKLIQDEPSGDILVRAKDVLATLDDLAVVYDIHGYPTVATSVRSFRNNLADEMRNALTPPEAT